MMGFINDDQREVIPSKTPPSGFAFQGLHGGNDDGRIKAGRAFGRLDLGHDASWSYSRWARTSVRRGKKCSAILAKSGVLPPPVGQTISWRRNSLNPLMV